MLGMRIGLQSLKLLFDMTNQNWHYYFSLEGPMLRIVIVTVERRF